MSRVLKETLNLPTRKGHTLRFRFQKDSQYALPTNPTPLDDRQLYPTTPWSAHALETSAPSPAPNCVYEETQCQITCNSCSQHYMGSTTRLIHDRIKEHLNHENSSLKNISIPTRIMTIKASKPRLFRVKTTLCEAFYISTSLPSIPVRNVANLQTFCFLVFWCF